MNGIEIERKFVIELPDIEKLREMSGYTYFDITQVYMPTLGGVSHRIRKSVFGGIAKYTETKKVRIDEMSAYEDEQVITEAQYLSLFASRDKALNVISKRRHTFSFSGQLFEIDVYPEWAHSCIMETELQSRSDLPETPSFIKVIKDVTGIRAYSNHSMAKSFPDELI